MESDFGLLHDFARVHELLRDAHGGPAPVHGPPGLCRCNAEERQSSGMDWTRASERRRPVDPTSLANAEEDFREFDVRSLPRWDTG